MRPIFRGFCINLFGVGLLHYISSRSDFGYESAEIFEIEKRLPDSANWGVADSASRGVTASPTRRVPDSPIRGVSDSLTRGAADSPMESQRVGY
jgi:hypothetical protein